MWPDTSSEFGSHLPSPRIAAMIRIAQRAGNHFLGRQLAKWMRTRVQKIGQEPLDLEVEGIRLRCYLRDNYTERKLVFMPWRFDIRELTFLRQTLPADGTFIDIGANVGVYSLFAAKQMNVSGRILALEPYPPVFERLRFNLAINAATDKPDIRALQLGVANEETTLNLHLNPHNLGQNSLMADEHLAGETVRIPSRPLLAILQEEGIESIDFLKIDIEGAEDLALRPFLTEAHSMLLPRCLLIENSESQWRTDLPGLILSCGYEAALRTRSNTVYQLPCPGDQNQSRCP